MAKWRKGINKQGHKCIYLFKKDKSSRGICYVYDQESLDGHLRTKCIDSFEYIEGCDKLKELPVSNLTKEEKGKRIVTIHCSEKTTYTA